MRGVGGEDQTLEGKPPTQERVGPHESTCGWFPNTTHATRRAAPSNISVGRREIRCRSALAVLTRPGGREIISDAGHVPDHMWMGLQCAHGVSLKLSASKHAYATFVFRNIGC